MERPVYEVQACRGVQGECRFALWIDPSAVGAVEQLLAGSAWTRRLGVTSGAGAFGHHNRFRVALAACPNACSMPQIRDVGIVATRTPRSIRPTCDACGTCERLCREGGIGVAGARAELCGPRCVGCGACVAACPREAIESDGVRLRILVGGRMGRHPRWAEQLCAVRTEDAIGVLDSCLDHLAHEVRRPERPADIVERVGTEALRRRVLDSPSGYSLGDQKE